MKSVAIAVAPLLLAACAEDGGAGLLLPELVQVGWQAEYNARGDGLGALVPVDVMVYDPASGQPTPDVVLHVWTDDVAAMPVPVDGVLLLDLDAQDPSAAIADEPVDPSSFEAWDAEHDEFVAVSPEDQLDLETDGSGVARMYLYVDAFPESDAGFAPVRVVVARGAAHLGSAPAGATRSAEGSVSGTFWLAPR